MRCVKIAVAVLAAAAMSLVAGDFAAAGGLTERMRHASQNGDGGDMNVDLAVRQVTVSPIRAHVGDTVRIEMLVENKAEGMDTTNAEVRANGKVVGRQLFTWGMSPGERLYRLAFDWDTRGFSPGEYRIRAEAFVWMDTSPFDNRLDVKEPVVLLAPGAAFSGGASAGGSATETDPRFGKNPVVGGGGSQGAGRGY